MFNVFVFVELLSNAWFLFASFRVFNKVKSRSAHMKSHRPPDQAQNSDNPTPSKKAKNSPSKTASSKFMSIAASAAKSRAPIIPALSLDTAISGDEVRSSIGGA